MDLTFFLTHYEEIKRLKELHAEVPGDETDTCQVSEDIDHGDHQGDDHNTGIYDVQPGAEIHFKPKR